jgi:large subunit ribosomal protein L4
MGALRSALAAKFADGKLIVVKAFDVKEPKSKLFRAALDGLKVDSTALLVEQSQKENRNLELSSRNLDGVELVRGNEVHPYHLLRYDRVVFSQTALDKLQMALKGSVSKRRHAAAETSGKKARAKRKKTAEVA